MIVDVSETTSLRFEFSAEKQETKSDTEEDS